MFAFSVLVDTGDVISDMPLWLDITLTVLLFILAAGITGFFVLLALTYFEKKLEPKLKQYIRYRDTLAAQKPIKLDAVYMDRSGNRVTVVGQVIRFDGSLRIVTWENGLETCVYSLEDFNHHHKRRLCHFPVWW